jgi:Ca2+-binding EF-hand superfamily protein
MGFNVREILIPPGDAAMRLRITLGLFIAGLLILMVGPDGYGQFGPQGGTPGGAPIPVPGGGAPGMARKGFDPAVLFDLAAKGKPVIVISEMAVGTKERMEEYASEKGITNGQITREQFLDYFDHMRAKRATAGGAQTITIPGAGPPGGLPPGATTEMLTLFADADFKRFDENGDGKLNQDEMPPPLRKELLLWDKNGDGLIDQEEYRTYFITRFQERLSGSNAAIQQPNPNASPLEDDLDKRPVVYRAGKLPVKGMPLWFKQLDTDNDGQVALYEWRQAGKDLAEFKFWDRDNDGFITPEEALHVNAALMKTADPLLASADPTPNAFPGMGGPFTGNGGLGQGKGGPFGKGGPGKGWQFGGGNPGGGQFPGFGGGNRGGGNQGGGQFGGNPLGGQFGGNPPGGQPGGGKKGGKKGGGGNPNDGN